MALHTAFFIVLVIVQAALLGVVAFFIVKDRGRDLPFDVMADLQRLLDETRKLNEDFSRDIGSEVKIVRQCLNDLDLKIEEARKIMAGLEEISLNAKKSRKYTKDDVTKLFRGGYDPVTISQISGIPVGEVQLIVDISSCETDKS